MVAPLVGAWIEICVGTGQRQGRAVAPLVGAWIEIIKTGSVTDDMLVAPLVGAWIEISRNFVLYPDHNRSLPSWERGLKSHSTPPNLSALGRSPRGSVD